MELQRKAIVQFSLENKNEFSWKEICEKFNIEPTLANTKKLCDWVRYYKNTGNLIPNVTEDSIEEIKQVEVKEEDSIHPKGFKIKSAWQNAAGTMLYSYMPEESNLNDNYDWSKIQPRKVFSVDAHKAQADKCMQIIFPTDAHLNRMELSGRTIEQKCDEVLSKIIESVRVSTTLYNVDTIVFLTGSDMLNSTGKNPFTTKGTLQETIGSYDKGIDAAIQLNVAVIDYLREHCNNLHVSIVLGNHDEVECYFLGKYLEAYYRNTDITFNAEKKYRKYYNFGNTGLCIHHGNVSKFEHLVNTFASENPEGFCKKYREVITGDKHSQKVTQIGVTTIRQFPCLATPDTWTDEMGFVGTNGFVSEIYDYEKGHIFTIDLKA